MRQGFPLIDERQGMDAVRFARRDDTLYLVGWLLQNLEGFSTRLVRMLETWSNIIR